MAENKSSDDVRARARKLAEKQAKSSKKRNGGWIKATVALVAVAIIAIVTIVIVQSNRNRIDDAGPVPASSNQYGGITLTAGGIEQNTSQEPSRDSNSLYSASASHTATAGAEETSLPLGVEKAEEASSNGKPVHLVLFQDYNCRHCAEFEQANSEYLKTLIDEGRITLEVRNLIFLDSSTAGNYSARSANAAYAVANQVSTDNFLAWQQEMFSHQGQVLDNDQIIEIAQKHGADIADDMNNNSWRSLVNVVNSESSANGVRGTPTLFADGQQFTSAELEPWLNGIIEAKNNN